MAAVLVLLSLFSLLSHSISLAESIISIDCGSSGSYMDPDNNVTWVGDEKFVTTGETMEIANEEKPYNTVRYFPNDTLNCYNNIPVKKGEKTLVRTMFYHGNYDGNGKLLPPSFVMLYDKTYFDFVIITKPKSLYFSEVIFAPTNENISVCLLSPSHNPFISSIEVYNFDAGMYNDLGPNEALVYQARVAFGGNRTIRYPADPYGRFWIPVWTRNNPKIGILQSSAAEINITGASNKPPETVLSKAFAKDGLTLYNLAVSPTKLPVYLALYFSEPLELGIRLFNVFLDGEQVSSDPIVPVFGNTTQVVKRDINASSVSQLTFQSTENSLLLPIINALELYVILKPLNGEDIKERYKGYLGGTYRDGSFDVLEKVEETVDPKKGEEATKLLSFLAEKKLNVGEELGLDKRVVSVYILLSLYRCFLKKFNHLTALHEAVLDAAKRSGVDSTRTRYWHSLLVCSFNLICCFLLQTVLKL